VPIVETIVDEERIAQVCDETPGLLGREGASLLAVTSPARAAVATKRLHVEKSPTFLEPSFL
jgi:hypothetical protein